MADFDEWRERIKDVASDVGKKTEDTLEVQKIKSQIRSTKRANDRDLREIGRIIYDQYKNGETLSDECEALCEGIEQKEQEIDEKQAQIDQIKGV